MAKQRESRWVKWVVSRIVRFVLWFVTKPEWRGTENVPAQGGVIIAANHLSVTDPLTVAHFLYIGARRWPTFTMKDGVMKIPVVRSVARSTGQIPIKRGSADAVKALGEAEKALVQDGSSVIFYPEGTCTRDPQLWPMTAKNGVARLALTTGVPVVPVAHWGEQDILPYGEKKPRLLPPRKRIQFNAGPPVDLSAFQGQPLTATVLDGATRAIMADITALQAQIRGERPPAEPFDYRKARQEQAEARRAERGEGTGEAETGGDESPGGTADSDNGKNSTGA
ncbi:MULTISPECIES: lysophospholipid acyltransferase family protein [unclassified Nocardiopsis]|uniref:lysophospholipid acyltransferase family protein n=1 Tax=unclassified Nocardiopsis TaxID=2649073 RepID=UPI0033DA7D79